MPAAPSVDCAVRALCDQLTTLADALVRGDVAAIEASGATTGRLASTLHGLAATDVASPASPRLLAETRWALLRCQRLGLSLTWLAGGPCGDGSPPTYLPTGAPSSPSAGRTSLEVLA